MKQTRRNQVVKRFMLNKSEVIIRWPRKSDLKDLLRVLGEWYREREAKGEKKKRRNPKDKNWWLSRVLSPDRRVAATLILEIDGEAVGVVDIKKNPYPAPHTAFVSMVFVAKKYRHKGLGKILLQAAVSEARKVLKIKLVTLEADGVNANAIKMYHSCGFKEAGRIKKARILYDEYVDRITMVRYFSS